MLIAGDDAAAKATVGKLCEDLGWRPVDVGPLSSSLHLEHMTLLWIKMAGCRARARTSSGRCSSAEAKLHP